MPDYFPFKPQNIRSPEARRFVVWLNANGYNRTWHGYDAKIRSQYANTEKINRADMAEIQRVMEDPWFGVPRA